MQYPIIDSHCHIYPDKIAEKAVEGIGSFYDLPMCYDGKASTLIEKGNQIGVCHNIIFSVATTPHQVGSINSFISNCVKEGEGRFTGLGALHPDTENVASEIENIKALGLKGVKLHPDFQKFDIDSKDAYKMYELAEGRLAGFFAHFASSVFFLDWGTLERGANNTFMTLLKRPINTRRITTIIVTKAAAMLYLA